jgi:hypothetical protein
VPIMGVRWRVEEILNFTRDCDETQFAWNWFWLCWDFYLKKGCEFVLAVVCSCYVVRILKIETVSVDSRRLPPNSCLRPPHNTKRVSHCKCEGYLVSKFHFNHCQNLHLSPFSLRFRSPEVMLESWGLSMWVFRTYFYQSCGKSPPCVSWRCISWQWRRLFLFAN